MEGILWDSLDLVGTAGVTVCTQKRVDGGHYGHTVTEIQLFRVLDSGRVWQAATER